MNWRLVTNLVFLLLLLLTARRQWLFRASDEQLRRRAKVKRFYGFVAIVAGVWFLWVSAHATGGYSMYTEVLGALCLLAFVVISPIERYRGEVFDRMKRAIERRGA